MSKKPKEKAEFRPRAAPPDGTEKGSLHWLYRSTGAPAWMVATWNGKAWNLMDGGSHQPAELVWWSYAGEATPPPVPESK